MNVQCNRLDRGFELYKEEFEKKALEVLNSGWYALGIELKSFEKEFSDYLGADYCVGVASGLDALILAFRILGIGAGDEVIVPANTYIASIMGVTINGAVPVFVEPDQYHNINAEKIEACITDRTKAILAVHLYGQAADMTVIMELAQKYQLKVVEDCAQSHGASWKDKVTGTIGDIGCFSFYPTKNLGAFGDGGAIVTNSENIAKEARKLRNYGSERKYQFEEVGMNSRLDEIQAGLLRVRLKHMEELNAERKTICKRYLDKLDSREIILPEVRKDADPVWHQFVIRCREREVLMEYLQREGVATMIHYPVPPHLSKAYGYLGKQRGDFPITEQYADEVVSLPLYNGMRREEQDYVIEKINSFYENK